MNWMRLPMWFAILNFWTIGFRAVCGEPHDRPIDQGPLRPDRNIVFVITDDQSKTLGCYGDPIAKTPNIDSLARDGVRFDNALATTASCSASRSVILSGLHNHKNGQYGHSHDFHKFSSYLDVVSLSLPRALAAAGYRTARCGKYHVAPESVYHFETTIPANDRSTVEMAERCREFISAESEKPFFLYFATSDPHRSAEVDATSQSILKPNLFGNKKDRGSYPLVEEVFYDPNALPVPNFLPDSIETREELAQYYQAGSRVDQGLGRLIDILKEAGMFDKTLIVYTSDHGMAFAGAKTTVYEPGLQVPLIVRDPYQIQRGFASKAFVSHVDMAPTLLDYVGALDSKVNSPKSWQEPDRFWRTQGHSAQENRSGPNKFRSFQGQSWLHCLSSPDAMHHESIFASHTFHEIQMYYPMRVYRDQRYKLIWNIAHRLDYPFASDLWVASSWQAQHQKGPTAGYGQRTVEAYIHRPEFELYDLASDPHETVNLALAPDRVELLEDYKSRLRELQKTLEDPWITKWEYE